MIIRLFLLILLLNVKFYNIQAQREKFEKHIFESNCINMPYRLLKPSSLEYGEKYPLVLYFHGIGVRGDDNEKTLINGVWHLAKDEFQEKFPAFVLVPQCPENMKWTEYFSANERVVFNNEQTISMKTAIELMFSIIENYPIDSKRIYVSGMSMGGFATWEILIRYPDLFAAAVPVCGGGDVRFADQLKNIPIWAFHGENDKIVPLERSTEMVESINNLGGKAKISIIKNVGHDVWHQTYEMLEMYEWLFDQKKSKN